VCTAGRVLAAEEPDSMPLVSTKLVRKDGGDGQEQEATDGHPKTVITVTA
jgi:hypothetical protein